MNTTITKHSAGRKVLAIVLTAVMAFGLLSTAAPITAYAAGTATTGYREILGVVGCPMGKSYSSIEIIRILEADGWYFIKAKGDHHHFKHPAKSGKVTIQHPKKTLGKYVVASIERQSGLKM
ncbi:hypothetical protein FACS1894187_24950 [Synergistales bacterium]|nr:hypothetical protein FACS1894187_24950 [Synergistales bacterium]